jgi:hypothetical protein
METAIIILNGIDSIYSLPPGSACAGSGASSELILILSFDHRLHHLN